MWNQWTLWKQMTEYRNSNLFGTPKHREIWPLGPILMTPTKVVSISLESKFNVNPLKTFYLSVVLYCVTSQHFERNSPIFFFWCKIKRKLPLQKRQRATTELFYFYNRERFSVIVCLRTFQNIYSISWREMFAPDTFKLPALPLLVVLSHCLFIPAE